MIELIKALVEVMTQVIPRIKTVRTDKKKRELGAMLFLLYVRLNEAMLAGEGIIRSLEVYIERMRRHLDYGDDAYALTGGHWIAQKVRHQITNFERLRELLYDQRVFLQIIDSDSYNHLVPLLDRKFGALSELLDIMRSGSLPLAPTKNDLDAVIDVGDDQLTLHEVMIELEPRWLAEALPTNAEWGAEIFSRINLYLQTREPRKQLAEIRTLLAAIREALESYFSITDVLLEVGDSRIAGNL